MFSKTVPITDVKPAQYKNFSCGIFELDEFLKRYAKNNEKKWLGRTFVLVQNEKTIGYYTLSATHVFFEELPDSYTLGFPHYPIPASRLCRLAVDESFQGKRMGEYLLMDSIRRVLMAASQMAIHMLIVDTKNEKAKNFYLRYGFIPLVKREMTLFLPISTLKEI